jgi:uncharacterized protein (TIGR03118 family)
MQQIISFTRYRRSWVGLFLPAILLMIASCQKSPMQQEESVNAMASKSPKSLKDFEQVNLVGDNDEYQPARIDPNLVNAWGIAFAPTGPAWVSAEGTGVSVVYNSLGNDVRPRVVIPSHSAAFGGHPTGQVFNGAAGFRLPNGNPARFIFAGADGVISAWNAGDSAKKMIDDAPDAAYLGITIATDAGNNFLYAANFAEGAIDVYDTAWNEINTKPFNDPQLPSGYSPFNIQNIAGQLYVMYAKVGADGEEEVGPGNGYVDIYNPDGSLVKRLISRGQLNAPWGVAKAPLGFLGDDPDMQNAILVGNFGDGRINAFTAMGDFIGQLRAHGNPIVIAGLWAISFAPATATSINPNWLFFAAGPDDEEHGLFGYIKK